MNLSYWGGVFILVLSPLISTKNVEEKAKENVVKLDTPKKVKPQQNVFIDITGTLGDDPKFSVTPKPETLRVLKDFNGNLVIILVAGDDNAGKTLFFVYADNKDKKTIVVTSAIEVEGTLPGPNPVPVPDDKVAKNKYFKDLKAAYLVSPNAASLDKLISVYQEMSTTTFGKRSESASILKSITAKKLDGWADLRKVRDQVQADLEKDVGVDDTQPFDPLVFKAFFSNIVEALQLIKSGK